MSIVIDQSNRAPSGALFRCAPAAMRGFTAIELVTTLVIIGTLTAMSAPRFFDNQPFVARGYVDQLAGAIRLARQVAIATECPVQVGIDAAGGYAVTQRGINGSNSCLTAGAWTQAVRTVDGSALAATAPTGVVVAPVVNVQFDAQGNLAAAVPTINVDTFALTINALGQATVTP